MSAPSSSSPSTQKISFTVRRPTPLSRTTSSGADSDGSAFKIPALPSHLRNDSRRGSPLARSANASPSFYSHQDSDSEEDAKEEDELVTEFDSFGVQRLKKAQSPLVIPALKNRDWRELARRRRGGTQYVPPSAKAETGADGSVGGLGTRDSINSGPQLAGLHLAQQTLEIKAEEDSLKAESVDVQLADVKMEQEEETEDEKALRALLAGNGEGFSGPIVDVIPTPVSESEAYRQDVEDLPDEATLDDYARIPVSQFGAAMLRGMGWTEGTAASRKKKGMIEPWLPQTRPALLGIGAKEREVIDDGGPARGGKNGGSRRPEKRYVPVVRKEVSDARNGDDRERTSSRNGSAAPSRRTSSSPSRRTQEDSSRLRDRDHSYDRKGERERDKWDHGLDRKRRDDHRDDHRRRDRDRDYHDRDHDRRREGERSSYR